MKRFILLIVIVSLVACSPQTEPDETPETENNVISENLAQAESTPDITIDVDTETVSLTDIHIIEDEFTAFTSYGDASFGEAIFIAKCEYCLILPDSIISTESDLSDVYARAIYYANGDVSPEGYLFNIIQDNEWNRLVTNEIYHVIAYLKDSYDAEITNVTIASIETPEPDIEPEATTVVETEQEDTENNTEQTEMPENDNPIILAVANADPVLGEQLFTMNFVTPCNTCHLVDSESMLVGPGLLNIRDYAESRIDGMSAEEYLYDSIVHPNDFIVEGFAGAMPTYYGDSLTDDEIYALVAYLMSLGR